MWTQDRWIKLGLAGVFALAVSASPLAAQDGRGNAPRGSGQQNANRGNNNGGSSGDSSQTQARQQIQAKRKAAIEKAEADFKLTMLSLKPLGNENDPNFREEAKIKAKRAQDDRKRAIEKANAEAKAAQAKLQNSR